MRITPAVVVELTLGMLGLLGFLALDRGGQSMANAAEPKFPEVSKVERFEFEQKGIEGWKTVEGKWTAEEMPGVPSGKKVLVQRAVENKFKLYYYDNGRRQLATATVQPPALGQWHTLRVVAVADNIQAYLDGKLLLNHRDSRFQSGQVGLWTKSDSVTAFDDVVVKSNPQQK